MNKQEMGDACLVEKVLAGEIEFFSYLVERYEKLVFSVLLTRLQNLQEVEDIVQETFIKAFRHLETFDCERKFSAWLLTIARNLLIDSRRKSARSVSSTEVVTNVLTADSTKDGSNQPSDLLMRRESFQRIVRMVQELPEDLRTPFLLRVVNEMTYQEIAESLELPLQTVKNRIFKARTTLRDQREIYEEMP